MKKVIAILNLLIITCMLTACSSNSNKKNILDSDHPITIKVWHYYNGLAKVKFDSLVDRFNETEGMERGIVVESHSYGDVSKLADAIFESANKTIGSQAMPDIFASYPDNAFRVNQIIELVDFETYFSEEELNKIYPEFMEEGRFTEDKTLIILPIAKATEVIYLNQTYWNEFVAASGVKLEDLSSWEGLVQVAELYYNLTGKAFFSIDSNSNYMLIASKQLGEELFYYRGDTAEINLKENIAYKIWENYYIPYLKGYFYKSGRFSSDDAKTGNVIAYTGSTAGAAYFPTEVSEGDVSIPIHVITLPYPYFKDGQPYVIQQGAGMCITKGEEANEYGASVFLEWFIEQPQNVEFAVSTAYFPVQVDALQENTLFEELDKINMSNMAIKQSIQTTLNMMNDYTFYGNKPFTRSYEIRSLLENHLLNQVHRDRQLLSERITSGEEREDVIEELIAKDNFIQWYQRFLKDAETILNQ